MPTEEKFNRQQDFGPRSDCSDMVHSVCFHNKSSLKYLTNNSAMNTIRESSNLETDQHGRIHKGGGGDMGGDMGSGPPKGGGGEHGVRTPPEKSQK